ncbi:NnrS family protein [Parvibaculaceae bacterium PLY_AMNH_Bact1]|nr:NnrS family protein [Parvibaculaceae bacterium PLY_AMNH_Bact1]
MPSKIQTFFSYGFRPFFVSAAAFAALSILVWIGEYSGALATKGSIDALRWHMHEMAFGYLSAVVAGFTLTAVANWTGRPPVSGRPLILLFTTWLAGRIGMALALTGEISLLPVAVIDLAFIPFFVFLFGREVIAGGNKRNFIVVVAVSVFGVANLFSWLDLSDIFVNDLWSRLALGTIGLLIALIGGRITPTFTGNWLKAQGQRVSIPDMGALDKAALLMTGLSALSWTFFPYSLATIVALMLAGTLLLLRVSRWSGHRTLREPLIAFLHVSYAFLGISLLAIGSGIWQPSLIPPSSGLHLLTTGTIGLMTFVVMTRALLGHSGRPLTASPAIAIALLLIASSALLRAAAPWAPSLYVPLVAVSGIAWSSGFLIFAVQFGPLVLKPRDV